MINNMKTKILLLSLALSIVAIQAVAVQVRVLPDGRPAEAVAVKMETGLTQFLTELNEANAANRAVDLTALRLEEDVTYAIEMLLENYRITCPLEVISEVCLDIKGGHQLRNIPLMALSKAEDAPNQPEYQEAVVNFTEQGEISSFYFSLNQNLYKRVIQSSVEVTDVRRRQLILDYVERFRTAYNQRDLGFLRDIFSEDALIITGKVIKRSQDGIPLPDKIVYTKQNKKEYLDHLAVIFKQAKYIKVSFDNINVVRHATEPDFYGVTLFQGYATNTYSDQGYVFLLWDFTDEDAPLIHVRTWQPDTFEGQPLSKDKIVKLEDFILD